MRRVSSMWVLAVALLLPVAGARAAEADEMRVTGNITTNNNCSLSLTNGGAVDYGVIPATSVSPITGMLLPLKTMQVTILCSAPSLFALSLEDFRGGPDVESRTFTLGRDRNGVTMATYRVEPNTAATVNGAAGFLVMWGAPSYEASPGCCWYEEDEAWGVRRMNDMRGFNQGGSTLIPVTSAQFEFDIDAAVGATNNWTLDDAQALDGLFVMELFYM